MSLQVGKGCRWRQVRCEESLPLCQVPPESSQASELGRDDPGMITKCKMKSAYIRCALLLRVRISMGSL